MKIRLIILVLLSLSLSFSVFSQEEKTKEEVKLEKKNKRIAKRFVHPKSMFFQISAGLTYNKMRFSKEDRFFERSYSKINFRCFSGKLEVGTKNDFFYEIGASLREYRYGFNSKSFGFYLGGLTYFNILKFHAGIGKRIIFKKSNINIINIQTGVSLSYNLSHAHLHYALPGYEDMAPRNNEGHIAKQYGATSPHKFFPTLYVGLTKDIRIFRSLYLTMEYQYDQGFLSAVKQKIEYYKDSNPSENTTLYNHFRGTAHSFSLGLKYRFLAKKYR